MIGDGRRGVKPGAGRPDRGLSSRGVTISVRPYRPADAADADAVAADLHAALPFLVTTAPAIAWQVEHAPAAQRFQVLVAEVAGRPVGSARVGLTFESNVAGQAFANVTVRPDARGLGAGDALLRAAERYLAGAGATTVFAWVLDDGLSPGFAERRGYRRSRSSRFQQLDLVAGPLPPVPPVPEGTVLRTGASFAADPRPVYDLDVEACADEPSDVAFDAVSYDDWLATVWRRPDLDLELTSVAVVDGVPVAYSAANTDGRRRYWSGMTATRRAYRGRGLAKLAKADSLHRARAAGYTEAFTGNDSGNAPMLAINAWFGYRVCATEWRYVREL